MSGTPRQPRKVPQAPERTTELWERCPSRIKRGTLDRLRNAVSARQAAGSRMTLEGMVNLGLILAARQVEMRHNRKERFEPREEHLPAGRRGKNIRDENGKLVRRKDRTIPRTRAEKNATETTEAVPAIVLQIQPTRDEKRRARLEASLLMAEVEADLTRIATEPSDGTEDAYPLGEEDAIEWVPDPKPPVTYYHHALDLMGPLTPRADLTMDLLW